MSRTCCGISSPMVWFKLSCQAHTMRSRKFLRAVRQAAAMNVRACGLPWVKPPALSMP